jgi:DNA-binding CsgD family transcriptional regulator
MGLFGATTSSPFGRGQADAILTIGSEDFSRRLIDYFDDLVGVDMCSAFVVDQPRQIRFLFASTKDIEYQEFAEDASRRYASEFWQHDPSLSFRLTAGNSGANLVLQQSKNEIKNAEYRLFCYEAARIFDRASIFGTALGRVVLVSVYRRLSRTGFAETELSRLQQVGDVVVAMTSKHASLKSALSNLHPPVAEIEDQLAKHQSCLSSRERLVCAAILAGQSIKDIARSQDLQVSTVITYKKRAYLKLGISTSRELSTVYERRLDS